MLVREHRRRAVTSTRVTREQIREVLLHVALYCGGPAGMGAFRAAKEALREVDGGQTPP